MCWVISSNAARYAAFLKESTEKERQLRLLFKELVVSRGLLQYTLPFW
jgi:hypothetical protein